MKVAVVVVAGLFAAVRWKPSVGWINCAAIAFVLGFAAECAFDAVVVGSVRPAGIGRGSFEVEAAVAGVEFDNAVVAAEEVVELAAANE